MILHKSLPQDRSLAPCNAWPHPNGFSISVRKNNN